MSGFNICTIAESLYTKATTGGAMQVSAMAPGTINWSHQVPWIAHVRNCRSFVAALCVYLAENNIKTHDCVASLSRHTQRSFRFLLNVFIVFCARDHQKLSYGSHDNTMCYTHFLERTCVLYRAYWMYSLLPLYSGSNNDFRFLLCCLFQNLDEVWHHNNQISHTMGHHDWCISYSCRHHAK